MPFFEVELNGWKAKMYNMVRKVDKLRGADKDKLSAQVDDLHKHIEEIEHIVIRCRPSALRNSAPRNKKSMRPRPRCRKNMKMPWRQSYSFKSGPVFIAFALFLQSD